MSTPAPEAYGLHLFDKTICTDSGRYFCDTRQFALPAEGNRVEILRNGQHVFSRIHRALRNAQKFVWIADWQMSFDVELVQRGHEKHPGRLIEVLEEIIRSKPVQVRVLLYRSPLDSAVGTYDGMVARRINAINQKGYPGSVIVRLHSPTSGSIDFSHHQKFVVVDGKLGYIGGIDLAYGRFSTAEFDVVVNPLHEVINEMYSPCQTKLRGMTPRERKLVDEGFAKPYGDSLIDEGCQPRMPWQDVHMELEGPAVVDIHRNFVRRWNMLARASRSAGTPMIDKAWLERHGAMPLLQAARSAKPGGALVQIVRSVSASHLQQETPGGLPPDDLLLEPPALQAIWRDCLRKWRTEPQDNILNAMVNCINSADNYIYIESQFFISQFGQASGVSGGPKSAQEAGIDNLIVPALARRIGHHIDAGTPFHVYLVVPVHPEGGLDGAGTWKQQWMALESIKHGSQSLIRRIQAALARKKRPPQDWTQYLTVLNMRSYGTVVQFARNPNTFEEDFSCEIGRYLVTEQIYIHSKLLIVDDAVAIIGSANINDRSLTGNGDTEIAAVVVDTADTRYEDLGSPQFKVHTRRFARELRRSLWRKHFGFDVDPKGYFDSADRVAQVNPPEARPKVVSGGAAPRTEMTERVFLNAADQSWNHVLDKPCDGNTVKAIQKIARRNREALEAVFPHIPRNSFGQFDQGLKAYTQHYPCAVEGGSIQGDLRTEAFADGQRRGRAWGYTSEAQRQQGEAALRRVREQREKEIKDRSLGVVPPALAPAFMTTQYMPHQAALIRTPSTSLGRRYITYEGGKVHNIEVARKMLSDTVVGFFVEAPLDWGLDVSPDKFHRVFPGVDITQVQPEPSASQHA